MDEGKAERMAVARCLKVIRETRDGFLDEGYAIPQPRASFSERFACDQAAEAIEREFSMDAAEQRRLLATLAPTPSKG